MKKFLLLLSVCFAFQAQSQIVINEVDADQPGGDAAEFIELIGEPFAALDGYVVVLFNGSGDISYGAYDLSGFSLNADGLFVLGNVGVNGAQIELPSNGIQNGQDGIAIYTGTAAEWPAGTPVSSANLIDAYVYGTADADDLELLAALTPGQIQANETPNGEGSMSRIPDGGDAFNTSAFVEQTPTPNAFNDAEPLLCDAGVVSGVQGTSPISICSNEQIDLYNFTYNSNLPGESYVFIVVDNSNTIVTFSATSDVDFSGLADGTYMVYGFTYTGMLVGTSLSIGNPLAGVMSDDCYNLSSASISVTLEDCSIPVCNGGQMVADLTNYVLCNDEIVDEVMFSSTGGTAESYAYLLTDANNIIVSFLGTNTSIFAENYTVGSYRIWGVDYFGTIDATTVEAGDDATMILTDGACLALSSNFIAVEIVSCENENGCTELFISEYFEGTSFNKAIEIYNPSNFPVNLDEYDVYIYTNGATEFSNVFSPEGILMGGETYVIANTSADAAILAIADATSNVTNFNGDDAIELRHNDVSIDVVGVIGEDPGTEWTVGAGSTVNNVLIRYNFISGPTTDWSVASNQYGLGDFNDFSSLGQHNFIPCSSVPQIGFSISAESVAENIGTFTVEVVAYNIPEAVDVQVSYVDGTAFFTEDYVNDGPITLSFPAGNSSQTFDVTIIDDEIEEDMAEFFSLILSSSSEVDFVIGELVLSIEPNDQSYPVLTIAEVTTVDADGVIENEELFCELRGVVHGINFNSDGIHFHLIDPTDGIKVFFADNNFGYTVTEGDSVHVAGYVTQFMGQAEIRPNFITYIDGGHDLEIPTVVSSISEENESHLVVLNCFELVDPSQWLPLESFFVVDVTDGNSTFQVLIDGDTELYGGDILNGHFTLTGIVEQMDADLPYDNNYVVLPRYAADITNQVIADFNMDNPLVYGEAGVEVSFIQTSLGATGYEWDFGDGTSVEEENPTHQFEYEFLSTQADLTVTLYASNNGCTDVTSVTVDLVFTNVDELTFSTLEMFPNPASNVVRVNASEVVEGYSIANLFGKQVAFVTNVNASNFTIDTSSLAAGMYVVSFFNNEVRAEQKLVVRK